LTEIAVWAFENRRANISDTRIVSETAGPPPEGSLVFRVDRFAITANVATYARLGEELAYWSIFPGAAEWGRTPAWGHATVIASGIDGVVNGARYFGLWPMASHVALEARPSRLGLKATAAHRSKVNPVYNQYRAEAGSDAGRDWMTAVFHPLFITSFVLGEMVSDGDAPQSDAVLIVSASSKTALGLAWSLTGKRTVVGLTSARNRDFVAGTGLYDEVLTYEGADRLDRGRRWDVVDFSSNPKVLADLVSHLGDRLVRLTGVGFTHDAGRPADITGYKVFFAPAVIETLVARWGAAEIDGRLGTALAAFSDACGGWFEPRFLDGPEEISNGFRCVLGGSVPANEVLIGRPSDPRP